jgi:hypothetical protein
MTSKFTFKQILLNQNGYNLRRVSAHLNTTMGYWHIISKSGIPNNTRVKKQYEKYYGETNQ